MKVDTWQGRSELELGLWQSCEHQEAGQYWGGSTVVLGQ